MASNHLILTLISDILLAVQIEAALHTLGYQLQRIESGEELEPGMPQNSGAARGSVYLGEPLSGRGSVFIARLAEWRPALVIVQLSSSKIPWAEWIAALKSSPATRRIPVLAFGPHTNLELRALALDVGCDAVVAQGRLLTALPQLVEKYARQVDKTGLAADCQGPLSELASKGIELFNKQEYFEAHEELEHAWMQETGPVRELYRGILQVAVAYLQITRGNYRGALKMFLRLRQWLDPLPDKCRGIDVAKLRSHALAARTELERLGPDHMHEFNRELLRPIERSTTA
jgi:predicted metal-dependent hydrolase/CheY-like chemotaxis protein